MSLLSKAEVQFLQGHKQVSKSYEYKLKSIIKKKLTKIIDHELPLINSIFFNLVDLIEFSNKGSKDNRTFDLTKISKNSKLLYKTKTSNPDSGNIDSKEPDLNEKLSSIPKYYINNPPELIKNTACSGGVEANSSHTIRLSISPSQGDDPGFKSRSEHYPLCSVVR